MQEGIWRLVIDARLYHNPIIFLSSSDYSLLQYTFKCRLNSIEILISQDCKHWQRKSKVIFSFFPHQSEQSTPKDWRPVFVRNILFNESEMRWKMAAYCFQTKNHTNILKKLSFLFQISSQKKTNNFFGHVWWWPAHCVVKIYLEILVSFLSECSK